MLSNLGRAGKVALLTFVISLVISLLSQNQLTLWISFVTLFLVIITGIIFDIIGTAVTAATEAPFHAMGADRVKGSKQAIYLIRHAAKVANFCNDVVGDIAGTISGAVIAGIALHFITKDQILPSDLIKAGAIAFTAALTVGGKALGKSYAIEKANQIIFTVGKILVVLKLVDFELKRVKHRSKASWRKARKS